MLALPCMDCVYINHSDDNYPCKVCIRNGTRISDHYKSSTQMPDLNNISTEDLYAELGKRIRPVFDKKLIDIIKKEEIENGTDQE